MTGIRHLWCRQSALTSGLPFARNFQHILIGLRSSKHLSAIETISAGWSSWWRRSWQRKRTRPSSLCKPRNDVTMSRAGWGVIFGGGGKIDNTPQNYLELLDSLLGGLPCAFKGTRASQRETGCYQVRQRQKPLQDLQHFILQIPPPISLSLSLSLSRRVS